VWNLYFSINHINHANETAFPLRNNLIRRMMLVEGRSAIQGLTESASPPAIWFIGKQPAVNHKQGGRCERRPQSSKAFLQAIQTFIGAKPFLRDTLGERSGEGPIYRPFMLQRNKRRSQCSSRPRTACHRETHTVNANSVISKVCSLLVSPSLDGMWRFVFFHRLRTQWPDPPNFSRQ
jgi:hypothetical protein